ncbi:MAG: metal-dependent hydrolase [Pedobacter sp.]|jgi:hypothetical protein|nr:metal-dependent hydrolase [Pedobacter sp.]
MIETSLQQILSLCDSVPGQIRNLGNDEICEKRFEGTWSKKEILGHLCDSAFVNLQRLIRGQVETAPRICYDQSKWVKVQNYEKYDVEELIMLWHSLNKHFYHIAYSIDDTALNFVCLNKEGDKLTLEFLIDDYVSHLHHHLAQIIPLSY